MIFRFLSFSRWCSSSSTYHNIELTIPEESDSQRNAQLLLSVPHDDFRHELALYVDGLLFTVCAHSGLENILAACPWPVHTVVGGFHLLDGQETDDEIKALAQRLKANYPKTQFYTSHCTSNNVFEVMKDVMAEQLHLFNCGTIIG